MEFDYFNSNINFIYEFSEENISFLGRTAKLSNGKLQTSCYMRPTYCQQDLQFQPKYPKHTKRFISYSQTLRVSKLCSQVDDCKDCCSHSHKKWKDSQERWAVL